MPAGGEKEKKEGKNMMNEKKEKKEKEREFNGLQNFCLSHPAQVWNVVALQPLLATYQEPVMFEQ